MTSTILFRKKEKWAQEPIKESTSDSGFSVYSAYTTMLPRGKAKDCSTGIVINELEDKIVFVLGQAHTAFNKSIKVESGFISTGELSLRCLNYGESDFEINPLIKLSEIVILKTTGGDPIVCDSLDKTQRNDRGFGSTDV
ncbi:hypothetical protein GINT2_000846 [Glugoides intestinalis]